MASAKTADLKGPTPTQAEIDAGRRQATTSDESAELKRLRRETAELKRVNAILRSVLRLFLAAELDLPQR